MIENRAGGGQIGADAVAKAPGDGQTLLAITLTHAANVTMYPRAPYQNDLKPVALLAGSPMVAVVPAASPIRSLQDLVEQSRAQRRLERQWHGAASDARAPQRTDQGAGAHVPYKGGAPSMADLVGGEIDVIFLEHARVHAARAERSAACPRDFAKLVQVFPLLLLRAAFMSGVPRPTCSGLPS